MRVALGHWAHSLCLLLSGMYTLATQNVVGEARWLRTVMWSHAISKPLDPVAMGSFTNLQ